MNTTNTILNRSIRLLLIALVLLAALLVNSPSPVLAADPLEGILSVGYNYSCALKPDGSVDCWGENSFGQANDQPGPFTQIGAGFWHTCGLKPDGFVDCWGRNDFGQAENQAGPFTQISVGEFHTCALKPDGSADCWGWNDAGQAADQSGPFTQVSAGFEHTCGLKSDGTVDCWGKNVYGEADDQAGPFTQVSAGHYLTCGLKSDGSVDCRGDNGYGQAEDQPGPFTQVSLGDLHNCGVKADGSVDCWGRNNVGQAVDQAGPFTQVSASFEHTCGLKSDGSVDCWGSNANGRAEDQPGPYGPYVPPSDSTPPLISPIVMGTLGNNGWYVSDVTINWSVVDDESAITSQAGCGTTTLNRDTAGTTLTCTAISAGGTASQSVNVKRDATLPALNPVVSPNPVPLGGSATVTSSASDVLSGIASQSCGTLDTSTPGIKTVACTATDNAGNTATVNASYQVIYNFAGFFSPVDNLPVLNTVNAGRAIPVKFSLGGNFGLNILAAGYPKVQPIACDSGAPSDDIEETVTSGNSGLQYDAASGTYTYVWKTQKSWAGTCRQLVVKLADGTEHVANFKFK